MTNEEATPLNLECPDQDCPGHLTAPAEPGLYRFTPCDFCAWSYDVRVWLPASPGGVTPASILGHPPGSSAGHPRG